MHTPPIPHGPASLAMLGTSLAALAAFVSDWAADGEPDAALLGAVVAPLITYAVGRYAQATADRRHAADDPDEDVLEGDEGDLEVEPPPALGGADEPDEPSGTTVQPSG